MSNLFLIKQFCNQYGIVPRKRFSQNFLIDENVLKKIVEAAELSKEDTVLEIGPGFGVLTQELAKRVKKVIAVEKDKRISKALLEILSGCNNVEVVTQDILSYKLQPASPDGKAIVDPRQSRDYKLVANLPYSITSFVLRKFLSEEPRPSLAVVMVQKEVAQRIIARPPKTSILSIMVQFYGKPKIISYVSKNSFWPQPKVDSAILKIDKIAPRLGVDEAKFFALVRAGFSSRRKKLTNNLLKKMPGLSRDKLLEFFSRLKLKETVRAEELALEDWLKLAEEINTLS